MSMPNTKFQELVSLNVAYPKLFLVLQLVPELRDELERYMNAVANQAYLDGSNARRETDIQAILHFDAENRMVTFMGYSHSQSLEKLIQYIKDEE